MVDEAEFFEVADALVEEGRVPSQRAIRERLSRRGSFSDVGPLFAKWTALRNYRPRPTKDDLPRHLADRLAAVAAEIWADGLRQGARAGKNERALLLAERDALKLALAEASAIADTLERRLGLPDATAEETGAEPVRPRRKDTTAFWNRVMLEIFDLLGDRTLGIEEIMASLGEETSREAPRWTTKTWSGSFLADRMRGRADEGKYFEEVAPGLFRRLIGSGEAALAPAPAVDAVEAPSHPSLRTLAAGPVDDGDDMPEDVGFSLRGRTVSVGGKAVKNR